MKKSYVVVLVDPAAKGGGKGELLKGGEGPGQALENMLEEEKKREFDRRSGREGGLIPSHRGGKEEEKGGLGRGEKVVRKKAISSSA